MAKMHTFNASMRRAKEAEIDTFLTSQGNVLTNATRDEQRAGIDRFLQDGTKLEYKTEWRVTDTGNFFIETLSNNVREKLGWAITSTSDYIVYYLPLENLIWLVETKKIRRRLKRWEKQYKKKKAWNPGYYSEGIIIPRCEMEKIIHESHTYTAIAAE